MQSAVLIIPDALLSQANAVGEAMGWGPTSYVIPLSDDGETVTHWGLRADVDDQFVRWITGADPLPDPSAQPVVDALIAGFSASEWGEAHLIRVLEENDLTKL